MASDLSGLGDLVISIGGDLSALEAALNQIPAIAEQATSQIAASFDSLPAATEQVDQGLQNLNTSLSETGAAAGEVATHVEQMPPALHDTTEASSELSDKFRELAITGLELAGIGLTLEALKEAILGSLEAFGEFQVAAEAMTAMTQNAEGVKAAMEGIPDLANKIGVSIQSLEAGFTKFTRYGIDLQQIPPVLSNIADGAKASGVGFDQAASAWERAVNTGALMARSLQNMGLSFHDIASAMGMAGASSADVTKAFKGIQDSSDGTTAAMQRVNILMAAMPDNLKGLATSSDDVTKSFTQLSNTVFEAKERVGDALETIGNGVVLNGLKIAIEGISLAMIGLVNIAAEVADAVVGVSKILIATFTSIGQAMVDGLSGNWKKALADVQTGGQQITDAWMQMGQKMADDFTKTGAITGKVWDDMAKNAGVASDGVKAAGESMGKTMDDLDAKTTADAAHINQVLLNAQNTFANVALGFSKGAVGVNEYTKALTDLNKVQMDFNGGVEQFATAVLLVADKFNQVKAAAANAQITFNAVLADIARGQATAQQYSDALAALNKTQMELNNGLENAHTAYLLAVDDFSKLGVQLVNAQTTLNAVAQAVLNGHSSLTQFDAALNKVNADFMAAHGGAQDFATVVEMVGVSMQKMAVAASNSQLNLQAWLDKMAEGYPVLQNVIDAMDKAAATYEKAHGGELDLASATDLVTAAHLKLQLAADKANTTLSAAYTLADRGKISYDELAGYINKAAQANDALSGSHSKVASAAQNAATAQQNLNAALHTGATESLNNVNVSNDYASSLAIVNGNLVSIGIAYGDTVRQASEYVGALQQLSGHMTTFGTDTTAAAGAGSDLATSLASVNGQLQNVGVSAGAAAAGINGVAGAALSAAAAVGSLGAELDRTMATASEGGGRLGTSVGLKPGDQYTQYTGGAVAGVDFGGTETGSMVGGGLFGPMGPGETMTFDPAGYAATLKQSQQAAASLTAAGTSLSTAAQSQLDAANAAADAAKMANAITVGMVGATNSLNSTALAAADAANQQAMANAAFASVITNTNAVTAGTVQALVLATNTMVGAATVITAVAQQAGVSLTSPTLTDVLGSQLAVTNPNAGPGVSGSNSGGLPFAPPVFPSGPVTVAINGSYIDSQQTVDRLVAAMVQRLQQKGLRMQQ
jgi:methyl-accepting chemotaxis protein